MSDQIQGTIELMKTDRRLGLVFGYGLVTKTRDAAGVVQDYYDLHGDATPDQEMLKAATAFAAGQRPGKAQHGEDHGGEQVGTILFMYPMTEDVAKGLGYPPLDKYGLLIAFQPSDPKVMDEVDAGLYQGFSFGGSAVRNPVTP